VKDGLGAKLTLSVFESQSDVVAIKLEGSLELSRLSIALSLF